MSDPGTEIVKLGSEIIRDPRVQQTIAATLGAPAHEAGGWLADQIRYRRFKSQVKMWTRATEILSQAGIEPHSVDLSVLVPLLESGSLQEDEGMAERWASLLAAAASDPDGVPPGYPEILRQLTPREAAILDGIYEEAGSLWVESAYEPGIIAERAGFGDAGERVILATENLLRLRLLRSRTLTFPGPTGEDSKVRLTHLGHDFVSKCRRPTVRPAGRV